MMVLNFVLAAIAAVDIAFTVFDVGYTEKGIAKGVGVEGNEFVTTLDGTKPSYVFLYIWNFVFIAALGAVGFLLGHNPAVAGAVPAILAADAGKHYLGGRLWKALLEGKQVKKDRTAWEKFLDLGIED